MKTLEKPIGGALREAALALQVNTLKLEEKFVPIL